jgi:hypothetical protein
MRTFLFADLAGFKALAHGDEEAAELVGECRWWCREPNPLRQGDPIPTRWASWRPLIDSVHTLGEVRGGARAHRVA